MRSRVERIKERIFADLIWGNLMDIGVTSYLYVCRLFGKYTDDEALSRYDRNISKPFPDD